MATDATNGAVQFAFSEGRGEARRNTDKFDHIAMNQEDDLVQEAKYIIAAIAPEYCYQ